VWRWGDKIEEDERGVERIARSGYDRRIEQSVLQSSVIGGRTMPEKQETVHPFPVRLGVLQRRSIAELAPEFSDRLKLNEQNQRVIAFSLPEWKILRRKIRSAIPPDAWSMKIRALRDALVLIEIVIEEGNGIGRIPRAQRIYQFKITLQDTRPPIWRRIQVKDCTLDKLHERIQTAMGWTNSHLNHFRINDTRFGDPLLLAETFLELCYQDSTTTKIHEILPRNGTRFGFEYEYDFGDSWTHEVLFEGCLQAEPDCRYPLCLEGERACPPEDVGGTWGYRDFLEALADPDHEEHERFLEWVGGTFDPEAFDPTKATKRMRRGLPNWRNML
jgi:hypothetical protein